MITVDAPPHANLYCSDCRLVHMFTLVNKHYRSTVEQLIPESLLHLDNRCKKRISVLNLMTTFSSQKLYGVHEVILPDHAKVG